MERSARLVGEGYDLIDSPGIAHALEIAVGHYLVAIGVEKGEAAVRDEAIGCQLVFGQGLLQGLQLDLGHVANNGATAEIFDDSGLEALVNSAVVIALAILEIKVALLAIAIDQIVLGVGQGCAFRLRWTEASDRPSRAY